MKRSSRAWILLPAIIVAIGAIGLVVSNFQKEAGLADPSKGGIAAVAAAVTAVDSSSGIGATDYQAFSEALLVAAVAKNNAPLINSADTRLETLLVKTVDCLSALREAWQAELDRTWDPQTHGTATYWRVLHPALEISAGGAPSEGAAPSAGALTPADVRALSHERASALLEEAIDLVS
jgi:hypothetical protein